MLKQFFAAPNDACLTTVDSLDELKAIDESELAEVSGGIGTVTIANPAP